MVEEKMILPVCCKCKKIRVDDVWIDDPATREANKSNQTHGVCPDCVVVLYPQYAYVLAN